MRLLDERAERRRRSRRPCRASSPPASTSSTATRRSCSRTRPCSGGCSGSAASGSDREAAEAALHRLERREFVQRERRSTVAGETEYAFRHALVREVAYEQIPRAQRGEKHRRVADWLETLGRSEDLAELLAHHYIAVLDYSEPDAELAARAGSCAGRGGRSCARAQRVRDRGAASTGARSTSRPTTERGRVLFGLGKRARGTRGPRGGRTPCRGVGDARWRQAIRRRQRRRRRSSRRSRGPPAMPPGSTNIRARAVELVRGRPPSAAHARALGQAARFAMLDGRWSDADRDGHGSGADGCRARPRRDPRRCARDRRHGAR